MFKYVIIFLLYLNCLIELVHLSPISSNSSVILESIKPLSTNLSANQTDRDKRTRNGRFLFKKIMNLVEGCNQQGCCSKGLNLFGFTGGDCCSAPQFNDDGLEHDYRPHHKHYHVTKSRTQLKPIDGAQKIYIAVIKKEQPKIRKTNQDKIKENEKILERWPEDLMLSKTDETAKSTDLNDIKKSEEQPLSYIDYEMMKSKDQQKSTSSGLANKQESYNLNNVSHQSLKPLSTFTKIYLNDNMSTLKSTSIDDNDGKQMRDKFRNEFRDKFQIETKSQKLYELIPSTTKTINLKRQTHLIDNIR